MLRDDGSKEICDSRTGQRQGGPIHMAVAPVSKLFTATNQILPCRIRLRALHLRQFRRPRPTTHAPSHRNIFQFNLLACATQQQTSAAQIPAPHKFSRKQKALAKNTQKWLDIFRRSDAPQKHSIAILPEAFAKRAPIAHKRRAIRSLSLANIPSSNRAQLIQSKNAVRGNQPAGSSNNENTRNAFRRISINTRVNQFPAKIKPADKTKNIPQRRALTANPLRQFRTRRITQNHPRPIPRSIRRRKQKNTPPRDPRREWTRRCDTRRNRRHIADCYQAPSPIFQQPSTQYKTVV